MENERQNDQTDQDEEGQPFKRSDFSHLEEIYNTPREEKSTPRPFPVQLPASLGMVSLPKKRGVCPSAGAQVEGSGLIPRLDKLSALTLLAEAAPTSRMTS